MPPHNSNPKPNFQGFDFAEPASPDAEGVPNIAAGDQHSSDKTDEYGSIDSQYTPDDATLSSDSATSDLEGDGDGTESKVQGIATPSSFLHQSNSSISMTNAFAPPFYNRPPTPLPPSPSLTSLLRPPFSTTTSRPTTPDTSENDTPNDTESAVTRSARTATTVLRASPKVPTYEYYGFVLYLLSYLGLRKFRSAIIRSAH